MVTQQQIEAEAQYQNPEPIGPQSQIPSGVHDMIVSWDKTEGYMSVRVAGDRFWFKQVLGKAVVTETNNAAGRIHITAKAELNGETLTLWRPSTVEKHPWVKGTAHPSSYQRLCYRRSDKDWRVRDEVETRKGNQNSLVFVKGYVGDLVIEWPTEDPIAHVFHQGPWTKCDPGCFLHEDGGFAHLYED